MYQFYRSVLGLLFPQRGCPLCGSRRETDLCEECRRFLAQAASEPFCPVCGRFFSAPGEGLCLECLTQSWPFTLCRAAGPYERMLREAIHRLKFKGWRAGVHFLGGLMVASLKREPAYRRVNLIVPVPLSKGRLKERGFNQAGILAGEVAGTCGLSYAPVLVKVTETASQVHLDREARLANIKDSFKTNNPSVVEGKRVVVIDDVLTTGSTMAAAAETLLEAGAQEVLGLVLAAGRTFPK